MRGQAVRLAGPVWCRNMPLFCSPQTRVRRRSLEPSRRKEPWLPAGTRPGRIKSPTSQRLQRGWRTARLPAPTKLRAASMQSGSAGLKRYFGCTPLAPPAAPGGGITGIVPPVGGRITAISPLTGGGTTGDLAEVSGNGLTVWVSPPAPGGIVGATRSGGAEGTDVWACAGLARIRPSASKTASRTQTQSGCGCGLRRRSAIATACARLAPCDIPALLLAFQPRYIPIWGCYAAGAGW